MTTFVTSRKFNQSASEIKKAATIEPVVITDRGRPAHVLMSYAAYEALAGVQTSIVDLISMPDDDDIEFDPPKAVVTLEPAGF